MEPFSKRILLDGLGDGGVSIGFILAMERNGVEAFRKASCPAPHCTVLDEIDVDRASEGNSRQNLELERDDGLDGAIALP